MGFDFPKDKTRKLQQRLDHNQPISPATARTVSLCSSTLEPPHPRRQTMPSPGALSANGTWAFPALSLPPRQLQIPHCESWWNVNSDSSPSPLPISKGARTNGR